MSRDDPDASPCTDYPKGAACCALLIPIRYKLSSVEALIRVARSVYEIEF